MTPHTIKEPQNKVLKSEGIVVFVSDSNCLIDLRIAIDLVAVQCSFRFDISETLLKIPQENTTANTI